MVALADLSIAMVLLHYFQVLGVKQSRSPHPFLVESFQQRGSFMLYEQELLTQPPSSATKPPSPSPSSPPPNAMQMPAAVTITTPKCSFSCDWAQATICKFSKLEPLKCQINGCEKLVHHICQAAWE
jgi:hypothetical protein